MAELAIIGTIASIASAGVSAYSSIQQGNTQQAMLDAEAKRKDLQAGQERAAAQFEMEKKRRETDRALSSYTAQSMASGAYDPTYTVAGEIGARGYQEERLAQSRGEQRALSLEDEAMIKRRAGESAASAGKIGALSAGLKGLSGFAKGGGFGSSGSTYYGTPGGSLSGGGASP